MRLNGQPARVYCGRLLIGWISSAWQIAALSTGASTWFGRLVYDAGPDEKARKPWIINGPASVTE